MFKFNLDFNMKLILILTLILVFASNSVYCIDDVQFYLSNERNSNSGEQLDVRNRNTFRNYEAGKPARFIIHGWMNSYMSYKSMMIREAYLAKRNLNIILVNWDKAHTNYVTASRSINDVGQKIADFVKFLVNEKGCNYSDVYLIGHSLGAHVAGMAGKLLKPAKVDTIIALDAARPGFSFYRPANRINKGDADYVQAIHTDAGFMGLGFQENFADADFYPNGGNKHPHCPLTVVGGCNHRASVEFFAESINSNQGFYGMICQSGRPIPSNCQCALNCNRAKMGGEPISKLAKGTYFLSTNRNFPFARGN